MTRSPASGKEPSARRTAGTYLWRVTLGMLMGRGSLWLQSGPSAPEAVPLQAEEE